MIRALLERYRCPEALVNCFSAAALSEAPTHFSVSPDSRCFGRLTTNALRDVIRLEEDVQTWDHHCQLPFEPDEIIDNLRYERYVDGRRKGWRKLLDAATSWSYYALRPALSVGVRKHLQRATLRGRRELACPSWPVDTTVEKMMEHLLVLAMKTTGVDRIPFIWFWPGEYRGCAMVTHDVESRVGLHWCSQLMDIDQSFGIRSSFELIPHGRYHLKDELVTEIRGRGFEVNVHDYSHDGRLFDNHARFLRRAAHINRAAERFGARGFRSAVLYRKIAWYGALSSFAYDMSVPNIGALDPQAGGCRTVMPYFIGDLLELPVTMVQDYSLFNILEDYSINLWKRQIALILRQYGLIHVITHPDYLTGRRAQTSYRSLLTYLQELGSQHGLWQPLPGEVNNWWRQRSQMHLVSENGGWKIEGKGSEKASIAYATLHNGVLAFEKYPRFDANASPESFATPLPSQV